MFKSKYCSGFIVVMVLAFLLTSFLSSCDNHDSKDKKTSANETNVVGDTAEISPDLIEALAKAQLKERLPYPYHTLSGDYLTGRFAGNLGDMKTASDALNYAINKTEGNFFLYQLALPVTVAAGDFDKAVSYASEIYNNKNMDSHLGMTVLIADAVKHEDYVTAWKYADEMPENGLGLYLRPLLRAWLSAADKSPVTANTILLSEQKKQPMLSALYYTHLGLISEFYKKNESAEEYYLAALRQQFSVRMVSMVGNYYEQTGNVVKAMDLYRRLGDEEFHSASFASLAMTRLDKKILPAVNIRNVGDGISMALFDLASVLHQEKATRLAMLFANVAYYLNPKDVFNNILLGDIYGEIKLYDEALNYYDMISSDNDVYYISQVRKADIYEQQGNTDKAISVYQNLKPIRLVDERLKLYQAEALRRAERFDEAIPLYSDLIAKNTSPEDSDWLEFYGRGICYEQTDEWDKAEADLQKALSLSPEQPLILNYLGYTWADKGINIEKALAYIRRAADLKPNDGYILDSMGWVLFRVGKFDEAVNYLERAISFVPNDPVINDHLGDIYWQVNRRIEAEFQWNRALETEKKPDNITRIKNKIENGYVYDGIKTSLAEENAVENQ